MDLSSPLQGIIVIAAPILLALAIGYAMLRNRGTKREIRHTEDATRRMYDQQDRDDKARDNGGVA
jgi:hypothetical protein